MPLRAKRLTHLHNFLFSAARLMKFLQSSSPCFVKVIISSFEFFFLGVLCALSEAGG